MRHVTVGFSGGVGGISNRVHAFIYYRFWGSSGIGIHAIRSSPLWNMSHAQSSGDSIDVSVSQEPSYLVLYLVITFLSLHEASESGDRFVNCERVARGFVSEVADGFWRVNQMAVAEPLFWLSYVFYSFRYYHITLLSFQSVPMPQRFRLRGRIRKTFRVDMR